MGNVSQKHVKTNSSLCPELQEPFKTRVFHIKFKINMNALVDNNKGNNVQVLLIYVGK